MRFKMISNLFQLIKRNKSLVLPLNKHVFLTKDSEGKSIYQYDYLDTENKRISVTLKHVHTGIKGNKFYQFVNPLQMTMERNVASQLATREFDYNMTRDDLIELCNTALAANASSRLNDVAIAINEIKNRADKLVEYETSLKLAGIYFLMDDEHPGQYNPLITQTKIDVWKGDDEARSFFLQLLWDMVKPFLSLSSTDLMAYLTASMNPREPLVKTMAIQEVKEVEKETKKKTGSFATMEL